MGGLPMTLESINVAMPTPFSATGGIVLQSIATLLQYYKNHRIHSVLICGSTGEQHSLKLEEKLSMIDYIDQIEDKSFELIFGVSSLFQQEAITLAKRLNTSSIHAIMLGFPPYIKLSQAEAISYASKIISEFNRDVLIYNNPGRTGFDLSVDSLMTLVKQFPHIVGIKEAGDIKKADRLSNEFSDDFLLVAGGEADLLMKWEKGFNGISSILANLYPDEIVKLTSLLNQGINDEETRGIYRFLEEKNNVISKGSFLPNLKYLMNNRGLPAGYCRLPLGSVEAELIKKVEAGQFS